MEIIKRLPAFEREGNVSNPFDTASSAHTVTVIAIPAGKGANISVQGE